MKIAFVYDRVNTFGGAERVLLALHEIWPDAPLFTAVYNRNKAPWAHVFKLHVSPLRFIPFASSLHELLPLVTPIAFESFRFDDYDVVVSITSSDAKSIVTNTRTLHICYCLTPTRYIWSGFSDYMLEPGFGLLNGFARIAMVTSIPYLRKKDYQFSKRPDYYLSISETVKKRIKQYYRTDSIVINPPVNIDFFRPAKIHRSAPFYLIVSRLVSYKKIDYVIDAFNIRGWSLKIIGTGIDEVRLKHKAKSNIEFLGGNLTDKKLCWYYQNCQALITPGEEDFGIAAIEAQACGKPVIALGRGGVAESLEKGITGQTFQEPTVYSLLSCLDEFKTKKFSDNKCRKNSFRFSQTVFKKLMKDTIINLWKGWK